MQYFNYRETKMWYLCDNSPSIHQLATPCCHVTPSVREWTTWLTGQLEVVKGTIEEWTETRTQHTVAVHTVEKMESWASRVCFEIHQWMGIVHPRGFVLHWWCCLWAHSVIKVSPCQSCTDRKLQSTNDIRIIVQNNKQLTIATPMGRFLTLGHTWSPSFFKACVYMYCHNTCIHSCTSCTSIEYTKLLLEPHPQTDSQG